jgi:hypothetical protein
MAKKKDIPEALKEQQESRRQETYNKLEAAAQDLKEEGYPVTKAGLIKHSGLAASTFSKPHVKAYILKRWGIGVEEQQIVHPPFEDLLDEDYQSIISDLDDLRKRLITAEDKLKQEESKRKNIEHEKADKEHEIKVLRGELDIAKRQIRILGGKSKKDLTLLEN